MVQVMQRRVGIQYVLDLVVLGYLHPTHIYRGRSSSGYVEPGGACSVGIEYKRDVECVGLVRKESLLVEQDHGILVASLEDSGQSIFWNGSDAARYKSNSIQDSPAIRVHISIKLSDIKLRGNDVMLKVFLWNKGKRNFVADNFTISLRKGNPILYGLIERVP